MPQINSQATQVATRFHQRPAYLQSPTDFQSAISQLGVLSAEDRADLERMAEDYKPTQLAAFGVSPGPQAKPFAYANGIAVIPIQGLLINRFGSSWGGWITGYQYISRLTMAADLDPDVELIVYDVNSGGGEVAGCAECGTIIASAQTPTLAVVDSYCYSAAYWLASQAKRVTSIGSGGVGSIGAMCMHIDLSAALEKEGVKITLIHAGKHKVDGNPYEELSAEVKAKFQAGVDEARNRFAETVAAGRGLSLESVLATEADCFTAQQALDLKLIDAIQTPSEAIIQAMTRLSDDSDINIDDEDDEMDPEENANTQKPQNAATAPDTKAAVTTERARIKAITTHGMAASQPDLVNFMAYDLDMPAEQATAILDKIVVAQAPAAEKPATEQKPEKTSAEKTGAQTFAKAMDETANPEIPPNDSEKKATSPLDSIMALVPDEMKS